jgi:hypothetical protein
MNILNDFKYILNETSQEPNLGLFFIQKLYFYLAFHEILNILQLRINELSAF